MNVPDGPTMKILLAEVEWVRALARVLVDDANLADDAAQETWVAALQRRPRHDANLRGWLAQVTRNAIRKTRRAEHRRRAREEDSARPEAQPSTLEVVERFSTQHTVASAVMELEEPYRRTVLLRYYEDLTLREIAQLTAVTIPAVESRLQRAQEMLRRALDREHGGDGRSWALSLVAVLREPPVRVATVGVGITGLFAAKVAAVLVVAAAGVLGLRALLPPAQDVPATTHLNAAVDHAPRDRTEARADDAANASSATARVPVDASRSRPDAERATPTPGGLEVTVLFPDGTPAAGIAVRAQPGENSWAGPLPEAQRTRGDGLARFRELLPGTYRLECALGGAVDAVVRSEETAVLQLRLPPGPTLDGEVVDARGRPVPHAAVWFSPRGAERYVGGTPVVTLVDAGTVQRTDADGRFTLPSMGEARLVGAWAEGHAPSLPHDLSHGVGDRRRVRLVLPALGGEVHGVVLTPAGNPIEGAAVFLDAFGSEETTEAGARIEILAPMLTVHTDAAGRFRFPSVRPGARRMIVRASGLARWRESVDVPAGDAGVVEVRLGEGMRFTGSVTADGTPVADALVYGARRRWWDLPDLRHATATRTAADGTFALRGLTPGACWLTVDGGVLGKYVELYLGDADAPLHADIRLTRGLELRGRVQDAAGAPLAGVTVHAAPDGDWRWRTSTTDDEGRFAFPNSEEERYSVRIEEGGIVVVRRALNPGPTETSITVPDDVRPLAFLTGSLVNAGGDEVRAQEVRLVNRRTGRRTRAEVAEHAAGFFRTAGIPAGEYDVTILAAGHAPLALDEACTLSTGDSHELGVRRMEPAALIEIDFAHRDGAALLDFHARLLDAAGGLVLRSWNLPDASVATPLSAHLAAGDYVLCAWAAGAAPVREEFRATAGERRRLALTLGSGTPCTLRFHTPDGPLTKCLVQLVVTRADGTRVLDADLHFDGASTGTAGTATFTLVPGTYVVEAVSSAGQRGSRAFTVGSDARAAEPFDCLLTGSTTSPPPPSTGDSR